MKTPASWALPFVALAFLVVPCAGQEFHPRMKAPDDEKVIAFKRKFYEDKHYNVLGRSVLNDTLRGSNVAIGDLVVPAGGRVVLGKNCVIYCEPGVKIRVEGELTARESWQMRNLPSYDLCIASPTTVWKGIEAGPKARVTLDNGIIAGCDTGISVPDTCESVTMTATAFEGVSGVKVALRGAAAGLVESNGRFSFLYPGAKPAVKPGGAVTGAAPVHKGGDRRAIARSASIGGGLLCAAAVGVAVYYNGRAAAFHRDGVAATTPADATDSFTKRDRAYDARDGWSIAAAALAGVAAITLIFSF